MLRDALDILRLRELLRPRTGALRPVKLALMGHPACNLHQTARLQGIERAIMRIAAGGGGTGSGERYDAQATGRLGATHV